MKLETVNSKNDWNIKRLHRANNYMLRVQIRRTRTRWEICSNLAIKIPERRPWTCSYFFTINFPHFTRYASISVIVFEHVNVCLEPVSWISIYPRAERCHCSTVFFVNSAHNSHHFLVFLLLTLNRKIFIGRASSDFHTISI